MTRKGKPGTNQKRGWREEVSKAKAASEKKNKSLCSWGKKTNKRRKNKVEGEERKKQQKKQKTTKIWKKKHKNKPGERERKRGGPVLSLSLSLLGPRRSARRVCKMNSRWSRSIKGQTAAESQHFNWPLIIWISLWLCRYAGGVWLSVWVCFFVAFTRIHCVCMCVCVCVQSV